MDPNYPWFKYYGDVPNHIDYPEVTMYEALRQTAGRCPDAKLVEQVDGL